MASYDLPERVNIVVALGKTPSIVRTRGLWPQLDERRGHSTLTHHQPLFLVEPM